MTAYLLTYTLWFFLSLVLLFSLSVCAVLCPPSKSTITFKGPSHALLLYPVCFTYWLIFSFSVLCLLIYSFVFIPLKHYCVLTFYYSFILHYSFSPLYFYNAEQKTHSMLPPPNTPNPLYFFKINTTTRKNSGFYAVSKHFIKTKSLFTHQRTKYSLPKAQTMTCFSRENEEPQVIPLIRIRLSTLADGVHSSCWNFQESIPTPAAEIIKFDSST